MVGLQVNEATVLMEKGETTFDWHTHWDEDKFFFVHQGEMQIEEPTGAHVLRAGESYKVERGKLHRTRTSPDAVVLLVGRSFS